MKIILWLFLLLLTFKNAKIPKDAISDFTADCENGQLWLNWTTTTNDTIDYFEIERSLDGQHWRLWDVQKAIAISDTSASYELQDKFPVAGVIYYRLWSIDLEGNKKEALIAKSNCGSRNRNSSLRLNQ